jgi:phosphorylcholine metabolism protein LicD
MYSNIIIIFLILIIIIIFLYKNNIENFTEKEYNKNIYKCFGNIMTKKEDKILNELIQIWIEISEKLNIKWSICGGTYIGAIRDEGRIPWDDDFDLTILEDDIYKLKNNIKNILKDYSNIGISKFWGGYKIFFTDKRAIKKFKKFKWNWPFIDIFTIKDNKKSTSCFVLNKNELPLYKTKFHNIDVNIATNFNNIREPIQNKKWKTELIDTGYRHQIEKKIKTKCEKRYK